MKKIGRNDKCLCDSGKKYKQCCLVKRDGLKLKEEEKYTEGQVYSSNKIKICLEYFRNEYKDHKSIDISNDLNYDNYKTYQIKNYKNKIIMIAERNKVNENVFNTRTQSNEDIIVLYRGSYRVFNFENFNKVNDSINRMILTRLAGKDDK